MQLKVAAMADNQDNENIKASVSADLSLGSIRAEKPILVDNSHVRGMSDANSVFVELMRQLSPLISEEPEVILRFVARLDDIYMLNLCDNRSFITRVLSLVPGVFLRFSADCLRNGRDWKQCKQQLLHEFFPHFIRERLIRDLITFNFHYHTTPVRQYIDQVFSGARFLEYDAEEQNLVDRIVMNLHLDILAQSAFVDGPCSRKELYDVVGIVEEKMAVVIERQRYLSAQQIASREEQRDRQVRRKVSDQSRPLKCWHCGRLRHIQRNCHRKTQQSGNGRGPGGTQNSGQEQ